MRIRQIRFDGWGSLSGQVTLDPERLALLIVDTDRERADLVTALEALMSGEPQPRRGAPGRLEAELELETLEEDGPEVGEGVHAGRICWRNIGKEHPGPEGTTPSTRLEILAGRRANPWLIDGEELAGYTDLADLVSWVRVWVDSTAGYRSAEDVRMVLNSGLIAYPGMLVDNGPIAEELVRLDHALERIAAETGSLEEDRRHAAVALAGLDKVRKQIVAVETPLLTLEKQETRVRYGQLFEQVEAHRKAHGRVKTLRKEATALQEMSKFPPPAQVDTVEQLMADWQTGRARMEQLDESIADLKSALDRCAAAAHKRHWAAGAFPDTARQVDSLVRRLNVVNDRLATQSQICEGETRRGEREGAAVAEFAELDGKVRDVNGEDRAFVVGSFPSVLDRFFRFVSMAGGLKSTEKRLGTVRSLQVRIHGAAVLMIGMGLTFAVGIPFSQWNQPEITDGPYVIGGGVFLFCLGTGLWFSAGGILAKRRELLESQAAGLMMPLELEGLRLSVLELKMEEICRKHGYGSGEDMARDLVRYESLCKLPATGAWRTAQDEMRRVRAHEMAPLAAEAHALLSSYRFPRKANSDPLEAIVHVFHELRTWTAGVALAKRLEDTLQRTQKEKAELEPVQTGRLEKLRSLLSACFVAADPGVEPGAALTQLKTQRRKYERWVAIRTREIPRVRPLMMRPAELKRTARELRRHARLVGFDETRSRPRTLTPEESQLVRRLTIARRRLTMLRDKERTLTAEAKSRLTSYHRRLPALLDRRRRLLAAKDRAIVFQRAIETALAELDSVTSVVRPGVAHLLNSEANPRWLRFRPSLEGVRFEPDLALSLPHGSERQSPYDARLAHIAVRATLATRCGPGRYGCPLVLVEPFEKAGPAELGSFVNFLVTQVGPRPQVIVVSRRRSRYEKVRWEQPLVFKKIQILEVRP